MVVTPDQEQQLVHRRPTGGRERTGEGPTGFRSLVRDSIVFGGGIWAGAAIGFVMLPVYTRFLTVSEYGQLELLNRTAQIIVMVMAVGLRASIIRHYFESDDPNYRRLLAGSSLVFLGTLGAAAATASVVVAPRLAALLLGSAALSGVMQLMVLTCAAELALLTPTALMQARQQSVAFTCTRLAQLVLVAALNILFLVVLDQGLRGAVRASLLGTAVPALALVVFTAAREGMRVSWQVIRDLLRFGLPLVPAGLLSFVMGFADRYVLNTYAGPWSVGVYSLACRFGMVLGLIVFDPLMKVWIPFQMRVLRSHDAPATFARVLTYVWGLALWLGLLVSIAAPYLIRAMSSADYAAASGIVPLACLASALWGASLVLDGAIYIAKRTILKPFIFAIGALVSIGLNFVLVRSLGATGAALAAVATQSTFVLVTYLAATRFYPIPYEFGRLSKLLGVAAALYMLSTRITGEGWDYAALKAAIVCLYPATMWAARFFTQEELRQAARLAGRLRWPWQRSGAFADPEPLDEAVPTASANMRRW